MTQEKDSIILKTFKMLHRYSTTMPKCGMMLPEHGRINNMETYTIQQIINTLQQEIDNGTDPETKITFGMINGHPDHREDLPKIEPHPHNPNELILFT